MIINFQIISFRNHHYENRGYVKYITFDSGHRYTIGSLLYNSTMLRKRMYISDGSTSHITYGGIKTAVWINILSIVRHRVIIRLSL